MPWHLFAAGIHPLAVSAALSELYGRLIFDLGFVHADPHPGNVLVHAEPWGENPTKSLSAEGPSFERRRRGHSALLLSSLNAGIFEKNNNHHYYNYKNNNNKYYDNNIHKRCRLRLTLLDHGLYCSLSEQFRCTYARLWLAMQRGDIAAVTACANEFGVEKLAGLLAVILSLRSEDR